MPKEGNNHHCKCGKSTRRSSRLGYCPHCQERCTGDDTTKHESFIKNQGYPCERCQAIRDAITKREKDEIAKTKAKDVVEDQLGGMRSVLSKRGRGGRGARGPKERTTKEVTEQKTAETPAIECAVGVVEEKVEGKNTKRGEVIVGEAAKEEEKTGEGKEETRGRDGGEQEKGQYEREQETAAEPGNK